MTDARFAAAQESGSGPERRKRCPLTVAMGGIARLVTHLSFVDLNPEADRVHFDRFLYTAYHLLWKTLLIALKQHEEQN